MPDTKVDWTDDRIAMMRRMWPDSFVDASQIACALGCGATKNAVIGKACRLGLGPKPQSSEARQRGQAAGAATKRARSKRPRIVSGKALAERREQQLAIGLAAIAKVEAEAGARQNKESLFGTSRIKMLSFDGPLEEMPIALQPKRFRPVLAADNPTIVKVEKAWDPYSHMRSARALGDALAALTRDRKTGEIFHGQA